MPDLPPKVSWAEAVMRLGLRLIDKGQGLAGLLALALIIVLFKLDAADLRTLLTDLWALPWILIPVILLLWYFNVRFVDRSTKGENRRLGSENSYLRQQLLEHQERIADLEARQKQKTRRKP